MQDPRNTPEEPVKPDLKHDSMEFSAGTDGDDTLDTDAESTLDLEDEEISAEELDYLEGDEPDEQAAALNSAELDSQADAENFMNEPEQEEEYDQPDSEDDDDEMQRR
ncbi:MAG: hypothetical protein Q7T76_13915 [Ferruginibacter sp.]|nr:hypothetical protein [Ferruginibacter sp.]